MNIIYIQDRKLTITMVIFITLNQNTFSLDFLRD